MPCLICGAETPKGTNLCPQHKLLGTQTRSVTLDDVVVIPGPARKSRSRMLEDNRSATDTIKVRPSKTKTSRTIKKVSERRRPS